MNILSWKKKKTKPENLTSNRNYFNQHFESFQMNQTESNNNNKQAIVFNKSIIPSMTQDSILNQKMKLTKGLFDKNIHSGISTGFENFFEQSAKGIFNEQNEANKRNPGNHKKRPDSIAQMESIEFLCSAEGCNKSFVQVSFFI